MLDLIGACSATGGQQLESAQCCAAAVLDSGVVVPQKLLPSQLCAALHEQATVTAVAAGNEDKASKLMHALQSSIRTHRMSDVNCVVRVLARYRMVEPLFSLFSSLRGAGLRPDAEALQLLAQALVLRVGKERRAAAMRELPPPQNDMPEVGR